jgi:hypothetical protein
LDKEKAKRNLEVILEKMHNDTDITQLHEYHKLYKKKISLFRRSWAAAWLFMYYNEREIPKEISKTRNTDKQQNIKGKKLQQTTPEKQPIEINLSEEESKRLFISIGKNRRLFPREVITLIMSKTTSAREDIGMIRILDNYSFVQVRDTKADEIIEKLTGLRFRGRTLTVNYAKPKASDNETDT